MIKKEHTNLLTAIHTAATAKEDLRDSWHFSKFRSLLGDNLTSKNSIAAPYFTEDFPRVRSYRGNGPSVHLEWSFYYVTEKMVRISFTTDLVEAGVDIFMESDGCPGAGTKTVSITLDLPDTLIQNCTKESFGEWLKEYRAKAAAEGKVKAQKTIEDLAKQHGLTISVK